MNFGKPDRNDMRRTTARLSASSSGFEPDREDLFIAVKRANAAEKTIETGSAELEVGLGNAQGFAPQSARQDLSAPSESSKGLSQMQAEFFSFSLVRQVLS